MRGAAICVLIVVAMLAAAPAARAQADATPRPRSLEISAAAIAIGGVDFGTATAALTANQQSSPDFTLFKSASSIGTATGFDGRAAFNITRVFAIEGGFVWSRSTLSSRITSDVESVPDVTLTEQLDTYFMEVSGVVHLNGLRFAGGRALPFLAAGAGYMRQLDGGALLVDSGEVYHAGGGVKIVLRQRRRGFVRGFGLRADGRVYVRSAGLELAEDVTRRATWAAGGGLFVRF